MIAEQNNTNKESTMNKLLIAIIISAFAASATSGENRKHRSDNPQGQDKPSQTTSVTSTAQAGALAKAGSVSEAIATGGAGGNSTASATGGTGGNATASGSQVTVNTGGGSGSGLTGRMVPDVSTTAPITSTSCRNGISAGGSGNGWGGLLGFFAEDDMCEWRLLEANYRATGNQTEADAIRTGMTRQRCAKLSPEDRENFGALCPKVPAKETASPAFSSAG